jgi:hypothetical protein
MRKPGRLTRTDRGICHTVNRLAEAEPSLIPETGSTGFHQCVEPSALLKTFMYSASRYLSDHNIQRLWNQHRSKPNAAPCILPLCLLKNDV